MLLFKPGCAFCRYGHLKKSGYANVPVVTASTKRLQDEWKIAVHNSSMGV